MVSPSSSSIPSRSEEGVTLLTYDLRTTQALYQSSFVYIFRGKNDFKFTMKLYYRALNYVRRHYSSHEQSHDI